MAHAFTWLLLLDHDCFCKLTQDLDPHLCPLGQSKLSRSLLTTEKHLVEKSVIERLEKLKAVLISYDLWMSRKMEEMFLLMAHYCTGLEKKTLTLGCRPPLLLMVFPYLSMLCRWWRVLHWRKIWWGLIVMVVEIFGSVGRHWSQNIAMNPFFAIQAPLHHGVPCTYIVR